LFRLGSALAAAALVIVPSAEAAQSTGGVQWLDPLAYEKPVFYPLTLPTIATNYYIDMSAGSDSATCGTSTSNPCATLRGLINGSGAGYRGLSGLRGNSADGAAAINIRGTGSGAFYQFTNGSDQGIGGTPGKEVLIRPWGTSLVTFNRGSANQGLNGTPSTIHDIIIDGGDPNTGAMLFKFVANNASCGGACYTLNITGSRVTVARTQFTATSTTGSGWVYAGISWCNTDGQRCQNLAQINTEVYDCATGSNQCSGAYAGPCTASGSCAVDNFVFRNNIVRNVGGEGLEINPRIASSNYLIEGNAIHHVGFLTCLDGGFRSCRPAMIININQSGSVSGVTIRNNLMWDTASGCIWEMSQGGSSTKIYNNTCYDYGKGTQTNDFPQAISSPGIGTSAVVSNNLMYSPNGASPFASNVSVSGGNNLCGSGKSCGASARTWSANTVVSTNPGSSDFMKISSSSEAAATGLNLFASGVTIDYAWLTRVSVGGFDIGAFAVSGTSATGPTAPTNLRIVSSN